MAEQIYGWDINSTGFNKSLFAIIKPSGYNDNLPEDLKDVMIVGKIISDDESLSVSWESALEGNSVDSNLSTTSALMQTGMFSRLFNIGGEYEGKTFISEYESIQVFRGTEPLTLNITLEFVAINDAYKEVELPIQYLYKMATPQLKEGITESVISVAKDLFTKKENLQSISKYFGEVPNMVTLDYLGRRFDSKYVLESISTSRDEMKLTKEGYSIKREVNLSFKSLKAINRDEIKVNVV